ncbi:MAG: hypothetical protein ACFFEM_05100 [Candidatus Thorarchaeota archaeon]
MMVDGQAHEGCGKREVCVMIFHGHPDEKTLWVKQNVKLFVAWAKEGN